MSIPLTEIERINALLPTELFAGSKDWQVGSTADRVDWLLTMYASAKEEVERLLSALEAQPQQELDCVLVPRDLIGAACSAIDRKRDAPKTLEQLRRYTVGDLSTTQPAQQEPAATAYFEKITGRIVPPDDTHRRKFPMCYRPLVFGDTSPPARKPLTDEEIEKMRHLIDWTAGWSYINFARAIEAAHGIKGGA